MSSEENLYEEFAFQDHESEPSDESEFDQLDDTNEVMPYSATTNATSSSLSFLNYELFTTLVPDKKWLDSVFHGDKAAYDEFVKNAYLWDEFFEACKYKLTTLADFIHNEYFYKIVEIDNRVKAAVASAAPRSENGANLDSEALNAGLLPVLVDLTYRKRHFIIPLVYLSNRVPTQFMKMNLVAFGVSDKYPEMIAKAKREIETSNKVMKPVKDILRAYHVYHRNFD